MPNDLKDLWQICILTDTNQSIMVVLNKNGSVADLFKKFRETYRGFRKDRRLTLLVVDGTELQENDQMPLVDVDCLRDKCNAQLIVHVDGGGWPTEAEIEQQIRDPTTVPSLAERITTDHPDVMGLDDETPRVRMSCEHAIAPTSLALHCYWKLTEGAYTIQCPECHKEWSFKSIIDAACLLPNETCEFERMMISNRLMNQAGEIKKCPGCGSSCRRLNGNDNRIRCKRCTADQNRNFDFCWTCLKEWRNSNKAMFCGNLECGDHTALFNCLANCDTKMLNGIECPSRRACPECLMLIEHTEMCKHMRCPTAHCNYEFCFICLKPYPCDTGDHEACSLAPRQLPESVPPPPSARRKCAIL